MSFERGTSILDLDFQELLSQDIDDVRDVFLAEIKALENESHAARFKKLDHIFNCLFRIQGGDNSKHFSCAEPYLKAEHRFYVDLISTPGLKDISYFREYLEKYYSEPFYNRRRNLLIKIYEFYDNHTKDEIDKFNYIYRCSREIQRFIIDNKLEFEFYFNSRILSLFDKESLAQLYRECFFFKSNFKYLEVLLSEKNHKTLYMISLMTEKIKKKTGHSSEFLSRVMPFILGENDFIEFMNDVYDNYVLDEDKFREEYLNNDIFELDELVNYVLDKDEFGFKDFNSFCNFLYEIREVFHNCIFEKGSLDKIYIGRFDFDNDFVKIDSFDKLELFKEAFLRNLYGITLEQAKWLVSRYGMCMKELESDIISDDKESYSILKAIRGIVNLELDEDKIKVLQMMYYNNFVENGEFGKNKFGCSLVLESLFSKMIINTFNNKLLVVSKLELISDNGVKIYDSGDNFDFVLTSLGGVGDFYREYLNIKSKWNSASLVREHGLSCTHVNNQNLGVINLDSVLIGFNHIPECSLNLMGYSDIFSAGDNFDLRSKDASDYGNNWSFYPVSVFKDVTRYGYNELLIDRYLMNDKDNILKLQPSYVIFYKLDDQYKHSRNYKAHLHVAKDFNIPLIIVDVEKIKENEKREISLLEEELFSSDKCNLDLMREIVTRYMNNYSGYLVIRDLAYEEDFSVLGMEKFFNRVFEKIDSLSDKEEWISALERVYFEEEIKYKMAKRVPEYNHSVSNFILKKYDLRNRINELSGRKTGKKGLLAVKRISSDKYTLYEKSFGDTDFIIKFGDENEISSVFLKRNEYTEEISTIINFFDKFNFGSNFSFYSEDIEEEEGYLVESYEESDKEKLLIENLIMSYLFESPYMIVDDMICFDFDCDISFKCTEDFDFEKDITDSPIYKIIFNPDSMYHIPLNSNKLKVAFDEIDKISNKDFLMIFAPVIEKYSDETGRRFEEISGIFLDKKKNMRNDFNKIISNGNKKDISKRK